MFHVFLLFSVINFGDSFDACAPQSLANIYFLFKNFK